MQANYTGNGVANFQWYNAATDGDLLGEGQFDLTNGIEVEEEKVGLEFDAFTEFKLKSILIYAEDSGGRQINLRDANGNTLGSTVLFVDAGWVRANLNFNVPAGRGHVLLKGIAKDLYANTEPANFPYEIDGVCSITNGVGILGADVFPLYYDWEIRLRRTSKQNELYANKKST